MFVVESTSVCNKRAPFNERARDERRGYSLQRASEQLRTRLDKVLTAGCCSTNRFVDQAGPFPTHLQGNKSDGSQKIPFLNSLGLAA